MRVCRVAGFTLIEVLVALLVLAVGVLGAASMQLHALRTRHQSALLSDALELASALAERMRANAAQMQQDDAVNPYLAVQYDAASAAAPVAPDVLCFAPEQCSSAELASFDIYEFKQQIKATLPSGRAVVCRDSQLWNGASHSLNWACSGAPGAPVVIKLGWHNPDDGPGGPGVSGASGVNGAAPGVALTLASVP